MGCYTNTSMISAANPAGYHEGDEQLGDVAVPQRPDATYTSFTDGTWRQSAELEENDQYEDATEAGVSVVSTGTPALNGVYSLSTAALANVQAAYIGIKSGDGLPGGGETFFYQDKSGGSHEFTAATFTPFALAIRDYYYALTRGTSPAQPVTIP